MQNYHCSIVFLFVYCFPLFCRWQGAIISNFLTASVQKNIHSVYYIDIAFKKSKNPRGVIFCNQNPIFLLGSPDYKYKIHICSHRSHFSPPHFFTTRHCEVLELDRSRRYIADGSDDHTCTGCGDFFSVLVVLARVWMAWRCNNSTSANLISLSVVLRFYHHRESSHTVLQQNFYVIVETFFMSRKFCSFFFEYITLYYYDITIIMTVIMEICDCKKYIPVHSVHPPPYLKADFGKFYKG